MPISEPATPEGKVRNPSLIFRFPALTAIAKGPYRIIPGNRRPNHPTKRIPGIHLCRLLFATCFFLGSFSAQAHQLLCPASGVEVSGGGRTEQEWVCIAVQEALPFFRLNGLVLPEGLTLIVTEKLAGNDGRHALGEYDIRSNQIRLLTYEQAIRSFQKGHLPFGIPMSPELWRSYVVHELTHAAAEKAFSPDVEKFAASEYIAGVAQLASLSQEKRAEIFRHFPNLAAFEKTTEITVLYYQFAPGNFALKAYLHYSKPENGPRFIKRLLREGLPFSPLFPVRLPTSAQ